MRRFKFNTKVGRSAGIGAFRTKGNDYRELAPKYRTLCETEHFDIIESTIDYSTTICGTSSYMPSAKFWDKLKLMKPRWDNEYWMQEEIFGWNLKYKNAERVYKYITQTQGQAFFDEHYIPVFYDNKPRKVNYRGIDMPTKGLGIMCQRLMIEAAGVACIPFYNYALRRLKDGREVVYGRIAWLRTFKAGQDLINYYRIAKQRNFTKVYGF